MPARKSMKKVVRRQRVVQRAPAAAASRPKPPSLANKVFSGVGGLLGGAVGAKYGGGPSGALVGSSVGSGLGSALSKMVGLGDYTTKHNFDTGLEYNSLIHGSVRKDDVPIVGNNNPKHPRSTFIKHREYIQDISGSSAFTIQTFDVNPGQVATFPWLSTVAENFETYRLHGMIFEFKSTSADALNSTNTALGTVILGSQYNSAAAVFFNKQQMENYEGAVSVKPSSNAMCGIECQHNMLPNNNLYIRTGTVPTGQDQRLYDLAQFSIATVGMQATAVIGELWVSYEVELLYPKIQTTSNPSQCLAAHFEVVSMTSSNVFGSSGAANATSGNLLGASITANQVVFPSYVQSGNWLITVWGTTGTNGTVTIPTVGTYYNCAALNIYTNGSVYDNLSTTPSGAASSNCAGWQTAITITGPNASITYTGATFTGTYGKGDVIISQLPLSLTT